MDGVYFRKRGALPRAVPDSHYHLHSFLSSHVVVSLNGYTERKRHFKAKLTISLGSDNCVLSMAFQDFGEPSIAEQSNRYCICIHMAICSGCQHEEIGKA